MNVKKALFRIKLGRVLGQYRRKTTLTKDYIAACVGIDRTTLDRLEAAQTPEPPAEQVVALMHFYGISPRELCDPDATTIADKTEKTTLIS